MKQLRNLALAFLLVCLVGCASTRQVAIQEPVGPSPHAAQEHGTDGSLVVYSARRSAHVDLNAEAFLWNNDLGRNAFLRRSGHTDYTIYRPDGSVFQRVRNAVGQQAELPTRVTLPTGQYTVEAEAEVHGPLTTPVLVTVVIEPGHTTRVSLEPTSEPRLQPDEDERVVFFAGGRMIGYRAQNMAGLHTGSP